MTLLPLLAVCVPLFLLGPTLGPAPPHALVTARAETASKYGTKGDFVVGLPTRKYSPTYVNCVDAADVSMSLALPYVQPEGNFGLSSPVQVLRRSVSAPFLAA